MGELIETYDPKGLNLGECIIELKRIAKEIDYTALVQGDPESMVKVGQLKQVIEHVSVPELVGYESQDNRIKA